MRWLILPARIRACIKLCNRSARHRGGRPRAPSWYEAAPQHQHERQGGALPSAMGARCKSAGTRATQESGYKNAREKDRQAYLSKPRLSLRCYSFLLQILPSSCPGSPTAASARRSHAEMWPRGPLYRQMRFASANAAPFRIPAGGGAFPPLVKQDEPPPHVKPVAKKKKALWLVLVGPLLFLEPTLVRFFLRCSKAVGAGYPGGQ